jgi:hypothetical protein
VLNIDDDLSTTAATAGVFVKGSAAAGSPKTSWQGYVSRLELSNAGTITDVIGYDSDMSLTVAAGTVTSAASFHGDVSIGFATATIGTYRGLHLENTSSTGIVTTAYGIDIDDQNQGSDTVYGIRVREQNGTATWGIYQDGTDNNQFNGRTGYGITPLSAYRVRVFSDSDERGVRTELVTNGNVTNYVGFDTEAVASSGDTLTNAFGLYVRAPTATGTITTAYGVFIGDQSAAGTSYGIYQAGSGDLNYFAGDLVLGTTTSQGFISISDAYDTGTRSGIEVELAKTGSGSGTLWRGVHVDPSVSAGSLTSLYYFACDSPSGGTNLITNIYGLVIPALKTGPAANATIARAISQGGDDDTNYFAGKTGFGNTFADANSQIAIERLTEGTIGTTESALQVVYQHSGTTGTLTLGRAITAQMSVGLGETIATAEAFVLRSPTGSGTITNSYGIYIEDQDTGPASAGWGIYQVGATSRNYFAAVVGTKNASPSSSYGLDDGGGVNTSDAYYVDGTQVVTNRQGAIADVTLTGSDQDGTARGKINDILSVLRTHGLIAP